MTCTRLLFVGLAASAMTMCGGSGSTTDQLTEIARVRSGDIDVVLLSEEATLRRGQDTVSIEFRRTADATLVDVGTVKASATMPMPGMAPMLGRVDIQRGDTPGRYTAMSDLSMAGDWRFTIEWDGPAGRGSATLSTSAQ